MLSFLPRASAAGWLGPVGSKCEWTRNHSLPTIPSGTPDIRSRVIATAEVKPRVETVRVPLCCVRGRAVKFVSVVVQLLEVVRCPCGTLLIALSLSRAPGLLDSFQEPHTERALVAALCEHDFGEGNFGGVHGRRV